MKGSGPVIHSTLSSMQHSNKHKIANGYRNPFVTSKHAGLTDFLRARFRSGKWAKYQPENYSVPTAQPDFARQGDTAEQDEPPVITWIGHSTVLLQYRGVNVITDPVFSDFASPLSFAGPKRIPAPAVTVDELPAIDVVLISHNHYDHLDTASVQALGDAPIYFVPLGVKSWMVGKGIAPERVSELDWWETQSVNVGGFDMEVTATPTQHFSGRGLFDGDRTLWASWVFAWAGFTSWFGGDTGYNEQQFCEIGQRFPNIDFGIIPIGAYAPQWFMSRIHVNPEEAVRIHQDIGARQSMGTRRLALALEQTGLSAEDFAVFAVGESKRYPSLQSKD